MNSNPNIIRKLGPWETMLTQTSVTTTSVYKIASKIDLNKNWDKYEEAVLAWQKRDPFLQCRIVKQAEDDFYFEYVPDSKIETTVKTNLTYLKLSRQFDSETESNIWKGLVELEPTIPISCYEDLLWRIKILELSPTDNTFNYVLIFTLHHSISEGRGIIRSILELNEMFEATYLNENIDKSCRQVTPCFENALKDKFNGESRINLITKLSDYKIDDYLQSLVKTDILDDCKPIKFDAHDAILSRDDKVYNSLNDLFETTNTIDSKLKTLIIEKDKYELLMAKCKKNKVKFNGCLNLIFSLGVKFILEKFTNKHDGLFYQNITNLGLISNRHVFDFDPKSYTSNGIFLSYYGHTFKDDVRIENLGEFYKRFWQSCKEDTNAIRSKIGNNMFDLIDLNLWEDGQFFSHLFSSNVGIVPSSLTNGKLLEITQRFMHFHVPDGSLFMYGACSISSRLCLSILYSKKVIHQKHVDYLIEIIEKIIDDIIRLDF